LLSRNERDQIGHFPLHLLPCIQTNIAYSHSTSDETFEVAQRRLLVRTQRGNVDGFQNPLDHPRGLLLLERTFGVFEIRESILTSRHDLLWLPTGFFEEGKKRLVNDVVDHG